MVLVGLSLLSSVTHACLITRIVPEELANADQPAIEQYFLKDNFDNANIVVEVFISSVEVHKGYTLVNVNLLGTWKSDGSPIEHIFLPYAQPQQCEAFFEVGKNYIIFSRRTQNLLPTVKVTSTPLTPRQDGVEDASAEARQYLDSLMIIWTSSPRDPPPNNPLDRSRPR